MKVEEITVHASRTLPHPCESYANIRSGITMRATLSEGDDVDESVKTLQIRAERLVEEHSAILISSIEQRDVAEREASEIRSLEDSLHRQAQRLSELKERSDERMRDPSWLSWHDQWNDTTPCTMEGE